VIGDRRRGDSEPSRCLANREAGIEQLPYSLPGLRGALADAQSRATLSHHRYARSFFLRGRIMEIRAALDREIGVRVPAPQLA
jgi:hypothetical protein